MLLGKLRQRGYYLIAAEMPQSALQVDSGAIWRVGAPGKPEAAEHFRALPCCPMDRRLRDQLTTEQIRLITTIYRPFADNGEWPLWGFVDFTLDQEGVNAGIVLRSLPQVRHPDPAHWSSTYGLIWYEHSGLEPRDDQLIALTVAGLRHLPEAEPLLRSFVTAIAHIDQEIRELWPSPYKPIDTTLSTTRLADRILTSSIDEGAVPPVDLTMHKMRQLLEREPTLSSLVQGGRDWEIRVNWASLRVVRGLRGSTDVDEYLDRVIERVAPEAPPTVPLSFSALDLPYAIGYLDAVWKNRLGARLFMDLDPASIARLTQHCADEGDFNSLMSALADVLSRIVPPGETKPKNGALERVRDYLVGRVEPQAADRIREAFETLVAIRHIRVAGQHSDARHRAVKGFEKIGLTFPPTDWPATWEFVGAMAKGALDVLREEVSAALPSS